MSIVAKWGAFVLGVLAIRLTAEAAEAQKHPQPKTAELSRAEKLVDEVFGKDMAKAKSAQEKAKLAQEILKSAREEQDMAVRFVALQAARRLAVEALDGKLGLEIVREIVNTYQPLEEMNKEDRLAEADRLWGQAERSQGREKLAKQLEAAEGYLYLLPATGIVQTKIETRLKTLDDAKPLFASSDIKILGVFWGSRNRFWDVSRNPRLKIEKHEAGLKIAVPDDFTDVWFGVHKLLIVVYVQDGVLKVAGIWDGEQPREVIVPGPLNRLDK